MSIETSSRSTAMPPRAEAAATLVVSLENLDVRQVSPLAIAWLGLPAERLLGRSLIITVPELGQALTRLLAAGIGAVRTPIKVPLATPGGDRLITNVRLVDTEALIDFAIAREPVSEIQRMNAGANRSAGS